MSEGWKFGVSRIKSLFPDKIHFVQNGPYSADLHLKASTFKETHFISTFEISEEQSEIPCGITFKRLMFRNPILESCAAREANVKAV